MGGQRGAERMEGIFFALFHDCTPLALTLTRRQGSGRGGGEGTGRGTEKRRLTRCW